jgi:hypothetical protein
MEYTKEKANFNGNGIKPLLLFKISGFGQTSRVRLIFLPLKLGIFDQEVPSLKQT